MRKTIFVLVLITIILSYSLSSSKDADLLNEEVPNTETEKGPCTMCAGKIAAVSAIITCCYLAYKCFCGGKAACDAGHGKG